MAMANLRPTVVRGLGEIALRVNDLATMQHFYEQIIGLPLMTRFPNSAFFKIAEGYGGHTQGLAFFRPPPRSRYLGTDAATSTIDHNAFAIPFTDFQRGKKRIEGFGVLVA